MAPIRHTFYRVPFELIQGEVLAALTAARDAAQLDPLKGYVKPDVLDPDRYIVRGRRYLLFGPEQRDLMHSGELLARAIEHLAEETVEVGDAAARLVDVIRASGKLPRALELWQAATSYDHQLPDWMKGNGGPSLLKPEEVDGLRSSIEEVLELPGVKTDPELTRTVGELADLFARCAGQVPSSYRHTGRWTIASRRQEAS